jgi:hypothetical protein
MWFIGMTLTWARAAWASPRSAMACSSESLTPPIRHHSREMRRPVASAYSVPAAMRPAMGWARLSGTSRSRSASSAAWREIARVTGIPSPASRRIAGTTPLVETVIRRALIPASRVSSRSEATVAS